MPAGFSKGSSVAAMWDRLPACPGCKVGGQNGFASPGRSPRTRSDTIFQRSPRKRRLREGREGREDLRNHIPSFALFAPFVVTLFFEDGMTWPMRGSFALVPFGTGWKPIPHCPPPPPSPALLLGMPACFLMRQPWAASRNRCAVRKNLPVTPPLAARPGAAPSHLELSWMRVRGFSPRITRPRKFP